MADTGCTQTLLPPSFLPFVVDTHDEQKVIKLADRHTIEVDKTYTIHLPVKDSSGRERKAVLYCTRSSPSWPGCHS